MINSRNRFHGYGSLNFLFRKGKTVREQVISLKYTKNPRRNKYRVAVIVAKKVAKNSPERNRIRRRVYETIRKNEAKIDQNSDIAVLIYDSSVATMPANELDELILKVLKKAGLLIN